MRETSEPSGQDGDGTQQISRQRLKKALNRVNLDTRGEGHLERFATFCGTVAEHRRMSVSNTDHGANLREAYAAHEPVVAVAPHIAMVVDEVLAITTPVNMAVPIYAAATG